MDTVRIELSDATWRVLVEVVDQVGGPVSAAEVVEVLGGSEAVLERLGRSLRLRDATGGSRSAATVPVPYVAALRALIPTMVDRAGEDLEVLTDLDDQELTLAQQEVSEATSDVPGPARTPAEDWPVLQVRAGGRLLHVRLPSDVHDRVHLWLPQLYCRSDAALQSLTGLAADELLALMHLDAESWREWSGCRTRVLTIPDHCARALELAAVQLAPGISRGRAPVPVVRAALQAAAGRPESAGPEPERPLPVGRRLTRWLRS